MINIFFYELSSYVLSFLGSELRTDQNAKKMAFILMKGYYS